MVTTDFSPCTFALCRDNEMRIIVFDMTTRGNIHRVVCGEPVGTTIVKDNQQTRFANYTGTP